MATSLKLDDAMKSRIRDLATRRDRSSHWLMREAIREYVEREEARESFHKEALASWQAYQETGQHLTARETADWLQGWGKGADNKQPECHD
jgi:predicted transcriptional regulator